MAGKKPVSVWKAVHVGLLIVNGPVVMLFGSPLLAFACAGRSGLAANPPAVVGVSLLAAAFVAAWLWWSLMVPRWRIWAYERVADIPALKARAVAVGLVWPDGHFFSRTEIKTRAQAAHESELEAASRKSTSSQTSRS